MSDEQSQYTSSSSTKTITQEETAVVETSTPPPSRSASDASDHAPSLEQPSADLNEFQVTSEPDSFDEKVLESDTFQWNAFPPSDQPIELSTFSSKTEDSDDDLPPLIDEDEVADKEESVFRATILDKLQKVDMLEKMLKKRLDRQKRKRVLDEVDYQEDTDDSENSEESEESQESEDNEEDYEADEELSEDEELTEEQRVMVRVSDEYPTLIRVLLFVFLFLHLVNHAFLLKERREYEKNLCFMYRN